MAKLDMINLCLSDKEKSLLKSLIGKKLSKIRHDPLDKFGDGTVYGRVELFLEDSVVMIDYDYSPYPLFGSQDDDHPRFFVKEIKESEATSALQNVEQIDVCIENRIEGVTLVEDDVEVEWDGKKDDVRFLVAILFKFPDHELGIQGDYMIPLLDILEGTDIKNRLDKPGEEFDHDPETKFKAKRNYINL